MLILFIIYSSRASGEMNQTQKSKFSKFTPTEQSGASKESDSPVNMQKTFTTGTYHLSKRLTITDNPNIDRQRSSSNVSGRSEKVDAEESENTEMASEINLDQNVPKHENPNNNGIIQIIHD